MPRIKAEIINFEVPSGEMKCFFISADNSMDKLAIVLPGAGYSFRQPLLHLAVQVLLQKGFKVLARDKVYGDDPRWRNLSSETEARKVVEDDANTFFRQVSGRLQL